MSPWARRSTRTTPTTTSSQSGLEMNDYSLGMNSYISNDKFPVRNGQTIRMMGPNMWRLAQNARIITLGEYDTRKGFDYHSDAAGMTLGQTVTSTTGAVDKSFNNITRLAQPFTAGTTGRMTKVELNLKNDASATGVIKVSIYTDSGGSPQTLLATSSLASTSLTSSYAYNVFRFASPPSLVSGTQYWIIAYVQESSLGNHKWSSTTSATTAKVSTDSGMTWSTTSYALNFKQYYATDGAAKGIFRAAKSDGTKVTLMAHNTTLYSVNDSTGALTAIRTGLSASATLYRFCLVNDIVYYVNGYDGYRKWDFSTESQVNTTNYTDLTVHKGLMFLVRKDDATRVDFSNFALYETFTSTDFVNVPAPRTGDAIASLLSINGYLLIRTQNSCYMFSGDDNSTFRLDSAPDQKGTYSPNTSVSDKNYNYFLSDDGVYKSNGTQPMLISENIYNDILTMGNRSSAVMAVSKGRLYLWYRSTGSSVNDRCYVWNLNYGAGGAETVESLDTDAYVAQAVNSFHDNDELLVGSSNIGQVYWQGLSTNDYNNLGGDINFLLQTHYLVGHSPAVFKEIRYWEPRFGAQSANYTVSCEYAYDQRDNWQLYQSVNTQGAGFVWGSSSTIWGNFTWGSTAEVQNQLYIPGEYRRVAIRYKHYAARQPHSFLGHTFAIQTRRLQ